DETGGGVGVGRGDGGRAGGVHRGGWVRRKAVPLQGGRGPVPASARGRRTRDLRADGNAPSPRVSRRRSPSGAGRSVGLLRRQALPQATVAPRVCGGPP